MQQDEREFAELLERVARVSPRRILEIGVFGGGTLARFVDRFPDARVVGIDPAPACDLPLGRIVVGESQDATTRALALSFLGGHPDVVHVDGDHSYAGTWLDVSWSCGLGAELVAIHDIACRTNPQLETWRVWGELVDGAGYALGYEWSEILYADGWAGIGLLERRRG